ncbi:UNVERIFIED_CONTAM: Immunity repressor protein [Trichonephila clavipes]|uniref:XRE family transcriptional regulator n=2 Tax=Amnimonas aquatica TaxID=2094561 RepID=A0A2P6AQA5_9GAMM|nr:XRE family transcriptional regulator [Amnimonas aquatica]
MAIILCKLALRALRWWQAGENNAGMNIGRVIRGLRVERGLKLEPLANDLDLATSTLSRIESGRHNPSLENLERIARALGVRVSDIFREAEQAEGGQAVNEPASEYEAQSVQLRKLFHALSEQNRSMAIDLLKTLLRGQKQSGA